MGQPEINHAPEQPDTGADVSRADDETLVRQLRQGDVAAFDDFIRDQWPRLVYYLVDRVRVRELAEDLAQEALARLWQNRHTIEPSSSVATYLYTIARNLVIDELRKVQVRRRWREREARVPDQPEGVTALQRLEDAEALEALREAIATLPPRRREALTLVYVQQLSHREAADVMDIAPQTVANQVGAALAELRRALEPRFGAPD